jgi:hypothetical protein
MIESEFNESTFQSAVNIEICRRIHLQTGF